MRYETPKKKTVRKLTLSVVLERLGLSVPEVSEELLVLADMAITGKGKKRGKWSAWCQQSRRIVGLRRTAMTHGEI